MSLCMFHIKFSLDTQFTFESLPFPARKDGELRMLPSEPAPERRASIDGPTPWSLMTSSTSDGTCSSLDSFTGLYSRTVKIVRGISVVPSTLRPFVGALSLSSSTASPDQDSSYDYLKIGVSDCGDSVEEGRLIFMVARMGIRRTTALADIPSLRDRKRTMLGRLMMG
jgi:hypothetical protein